MKKLGIALALIATAACRRTPAPAASKVAPPAQKFQRSRNLLALSEGGTVVSRTGEALITASPVRAIDGSPGTRWLSPPRDIRQTIVFAIPARSRIEQIGIETGSRPGTTTGSFEAELSDDGEHFVSAGRFTLPKDRHDQLFPIPPTPARFVRVTPIDAAGAFSSFGEIELRGSRMETPKPGPIAGCWSVNGVATAFVQTGTTASGQRGGSENATFDGGSRGPLYRFAWIRGTEYGLAALTVSPDGRSLSGLVWHEQAIHTEMFLAADLLGERSAAGCGDSVDGEPVFRTYIERFGYYPLFGLQFDDAGRLDAASSAATLDRVTAMLAANRGRNIRFTAHELLQTTSQENQRVTQNEIETLRAALVGRGADLGHVTFIAAGQERPRRDPSSDVTRAMYSAVEIELAR